MGATEEQMSLVDRSAMDGISYILILLSFAFLMFLFVNMLISLYERTSASDGKVALSNGTAGQPNGQHRSTAETRQLRDAEEFELEGLMSDDDEDQGKKRTRVPSDDDELDGPGRVGGNGNRVAL